MSEIVFTCEERLDGVIAKPVPANKTIEEWYRKMPVDYPGSEHMIVPDSFNKTVKACMPFFDAMTLGWMMLMPADFKIEVSDNASNFTANWRVQNSYIEGHSQFNLIGHSKQGRAIIKIFTMWAISTPPGWSTLFFPPMNHSELPVEAMAAVIDTDRWKGDLSIPCFLNLPDGIHLVPKGTPLAQVLPFKRERIEMTARGETAEEKKAREKAYNLLMSEVGSYQRNIRARDR